MGNLLKVRLNKKEHSFWVPYLAQIEKIVKTKPIYRLTYIGGVLDLDLSEASVLMLYGNSTCNIPFSFLNDLNSTNTILIIHRRNMEMNYTLYPQNLKAYTEILSNQITIRNSNTKRLHICKALVLSRFKSMTWLIPIPDTALKKLKNTKTIEQVRSVEAQYTKTYWSKFFGSLGLDQSRRDKDNVVNQALAAGSSFVSGLVLRWVLLHNLSPCHGFLHVQTNMNALVYDLMEPYRYIFEKAVYGTVKANGVDDSLIGKSLEELKDSLGREIYSPKLRQYMNKKNLIHGGVLALRTYLNKRSTKFVIPEEGIRSKGGRKLIINYRIPGAVDAISRYIPTSLQPP